MNKIKVDYRQSLKTGKGGEGGVFYFLWKRLKYFGGRFHYFLINWMRNVDDCLFAVLPHLDLFSFYQINPHPSHSKQSPALTSVPWLLPAASSFSRQVSPRGADHL
jgi:hypothetical protein